MALEQLPKLSSQTTLIERIKYQLSVGVPFIFVSGAKGAGKTVISEQILSCIDDSYVTAYITCDSSMKIEKVRELLLRQLSPSSIFNNEDRLIGTVQRINFDDKKVLIVVDDVHNIPDSFLIELAEIYKVYYDSGLISVVITAEPKWAEIKAKSFRDAEISIIEMDVPELSKAESIYVLSYYLKLLNSPYAKDEDYKYKVIGNCNGTPSKIRELAENLSNEKSAVQLGDFGERIINKKENNTKGGFMSKKILSLVAVFIACISALVILAVCVFDKKPEVDFATNLTSTNSRAHQDYIIDEVIDKEAVKETQESNKDETLDVQSETSTSNDEVKVAQELEKKDVDANAESKQSTVNEQVENTEIALINDEKSVVHENVDDVKAEDKKQEVEQTKDATKLADTKTDSKVVVDTNSSSKQEKSAQNNSKQVVDNKNQEIATTLELKKRDTDNLVEAKKDIAQEKKVEVKNEAKKAVSENSQKVTNVTTKVEEKTKFAETKLISSKKVAENKVQEVKNETKAKEQMVSKEVEVKKEEQKKATAVSASVDKNSTTSFEKLKDNYYSVQLCAVTKKSDAQRVLKKMPNNSYLLFRNSDKKYIVVHGEFSSMKKASQAIASFPEDIKKAKPWPKKIAKIKTEIK